MDDRDQAPKRNSPPPSFLFAPPHGHDHERRGMVLQLEKLTVTGPGVVAGGLLGGGGHPLAAHELLALDGLLRVRERRVGHDGEDALAHLGLVHRHGCHSWLRG